LLEAGVRGLPAYHFRGEYETFALPASRGRRRGIWRQCEDRLQPVPSQAEACLCMHNALASRFQCSPVLDEEIVRRAGDFFVCDGGVAALWDQRAFKRVIAR